MTLNNDMVQEVKVQSSNFAAEYGSGGMNISAVTKGGGSQFSGTVYDYVRHHKFAANDRSNSIAGVDKPKSSFNYPGGNVGGPILIPGSTSTRTATSCSSSSASKCSGRRSIPAPASASCRRPGSGRGLQRVPVADAGRT